MTAQLLPISTWLPKMGHPALSAIPLFPIVVQLRMIQ
jgi:hypothetical protein